jgi:general secretion pathway protein F
MQFDVRHVPAGSAEVQQELIEAGSASQVREQLLAAGSVVLSLRRAGRSAGAAAADRTAESGAPGSAGTVFDVAWWCRELQTLLRAGMTVVEAIETLGAGEQQGRRATVHAALLKSLREGASLSRAMRDSGAFPGVLLAGVTASERSSTLVEALSDYLKYDELLQRLRRQAVSAALYPAMVVALGVLISLFLLLYVIPRFARMYGDVQSSLSPATTWVLWLSGGLQQYWPVLLLLAIAAAALLLAAWRSGQLARALGQLVDTVAPLRRSWDQFRLAKLYQSLALLVRGGYTFDQALQVCQGLDLGAHLASSLAAARLSIANGKPASVSMAAASLTEVTTERLLAVGERTGSFGVVLQTIAERHSMAFTTIVERATRLVEPVLLLIVALVVGALVVMMYLPIFDIAAGTGLQR